MPVYFRWGIGKSFKNFMRLSEIVSPIQSLAQLDYPCLNAGDFGVVGGVVVVEMVALEGGGDSVVEPRIAGLDIREMMP